MSGIGGNNRIQSGSGPADPIFVDAANDRVGIGRVPTTREFEVEGSILLTGSLFGIGSTSSAVVDGGKWAVNTSSGIANAGTAGIEARSFGNDDFGIYLVYLVTAVSGTSSDNRKALYLCTRRGNQSGGNFTATLIQEDTEGTPPTAGTLSLVTSTITFTNNHAANVDIAFSVIGASAMRL